MIVEVPQDDHVLPFVELLQVISPDDRGLCDTLRVLFETAPLADEMHGVQVDRLVRYADGNAHALADAGVVFGFGVVQLAVVTFATGNRFRDPFEGDSGKDGHVLPRGRVR